ncbi:MAG: tetratricopeptide (TPR) repeat protein [Gammaproteobacteria bacterium]|jgi:tetratricopeptide (TPR) repeat protein
MTTTTHVCRIAGVLLLINLIIGCSTPGQTLKLRTSALDIPAQHEIESTPFFPQLDYYCGPATLASMVNFHDQAGEPDDIAKLIYLPELKGSLQEEMIAATRQFNLLPVLLDGRLDSIFHEIASGNPVLVLQNLGFDTLPSWHYAIAVGYDLKSETIVLRSGTYRRLTRPFSLFERTWQRAGNWALVIAPPGDIPMTVSADRYIDTLIDFEQTSDAQPAHAAYLSAAQKWPSNLLAHIGVGNTAYTLGDFVTSEAAYRKALAIAPEQDQLWNNLAYALAQQGKLGASMGSIHRAIKLAPSNDNYRQTAAELAYWPLPAGLNTDHQ